MSLTFLFTGKSLSDGVSVSGMHLKITGSPVIRAISSENPEAFSTISAVVSKPRFGLFTRPVHFNEQARSISCRRVTVSSAETSVVRYML